MKKFSWLIALSILALFGCNEKRTETNVEIIQDMMYSPAVKAQRGDRLPPSGTVPQGFEPYLIDDFDVANSTLKNPVPESKEVLQKGQKLFMTYCYVCHGTYGDGNGPVAPKMILAPPSLVAEKIRSWGDGGIYHLITRGRGLMGQYESQIPDSEDRWAIVHYVRHLQKNQK